MTQYKVFVLPSTFQEIKRLPGNIKHRVRRAIDSLSNNPRPSQSKKLSFEDLPEEEIELRRLRLDNWRIVFLVSEEEKTVDVIAVKKRPPYDYGNLAEMLKDLI